MVVQKSPTSEEDSNGSREIHKLVGDSRESGSESRGRYPGEVWSELEKDDFSELESLGLKPLKSVLTSV